MKLFVVSQWQKCEKAPKETYIHNTAKSKLNLMAKNIYI